MLSGQLGLEFKIAMGQMGLERQQGPVTWGLGTTLRCLGFSPVGCGEPQQGGVLREICVLERFCGCHVE